MSSRYSTRGPLFDATYEGILIVRNSTEPGLDSARVLKERSITGVLEIWDEVLPYWRFRLNIAKAAGWTIQEGEGRPILRKFKSFAGPEGRNDDLEKRGGIGPPSQQSRQWSPPPPFQPLVIGPCSLLNKMMPLPILLSILLFGKNRMALKHDKTGRSQRTLAPFIALERYLIASPAWQSLSLVSRCAFLEFLLIYNGSNNGRIALSARTLASRLRISRATATRAIEQLEDRGFIETTRRSGFNLKTGVRRASEWRLTIYVCHLTGERPSKKFMKWQNAKVQFAASTGSHNGFISEPSI